MIHVMKTFAFIKNAQIKWSHDSKKPMQNKIKH